MTPESQHQLARKHVEGREVMVFLGKDGWPVELSMGKKFTNIIRLLIHTRKIVRGDWDGYRVVRKGGENDI